MVRILSLDAHGKPQKWLSVQDAILHYAKDQVAWVAGVEIATLYGGIRRIDGVQSQLSTNSIIAIKATSHVPSVHRKVILSNRSLFGRDRNLCAYCGREFHDHQLSRDHIIPTSRGGADTWMNCVASCKRCNHHKDDRTPEQANMALLFAPYVPSYHEELILQNRTILSCQMEFLKASVPSHSRIFM